jgi:hypothetical protein
MSWKESIKKDSWKSTIQPGWKASIMRSKPITPAEMKADVLKMIMPEIKEKLSWKNTLSIEPKSGKDGLPGKDGKSIKGPKGDRGEVGPAGKDGQSIVGPKGDAGKDGLSGSQILFLDSKPNDEGQDGDLVLINKTFDVYYKNDGEWIKKGSLLGPQGKASFVAGLNGASAYDIAKKYGFTGTEEEWINSLGGGVDYAEVVDEASSTVTYIGKATPGTATSAASWQIKKITVSGTQTIITWASGNVNFDKIFDNRASLTYS